LGKKFRSAIAEMTKGKLIDPLLQQQVLTYIEQEKHPKWIIKHLQLKKSTFYRIAKKGSVQEKRDCKKNLGRPKKIAKVQISRLKKDVEKNRRQSLHKLRSTHKISASTSTLSRVMRSIGIERRKMKKRPLMNATHKAKRVEYALKHCDPDFDWSKWIFTDEKKFNLDGPDGYNYYWHTIGSPPLYYSSNASAKKYVMIWGGISKNGQTPLVEINQRLNAKKYCNLLKKGLIPVYDDGDIFLQDRASCHTAAETRKFLKKTRIETVYNPAKSPDLNPIENAWAWMAHKVYSDHDPFKNVEELREEIFKCWDEMPQEYIDRLIDSLPTRMKECIERKGEYTDY
jgi:transposase